jgi:hypothetical protein
MKHSPKKVGIVIAAVIVLLAAFVVWGPKPMPSAEAAPVAQATAEATKAPAAAATAAPTKAPAAAPTAAPAAPAAQTAPALPEATLQILAVPGNPANKNAITTTIKMMTDTAVGPKNTVIALFTSGLTNVPISVPVKLQLVPADPNFKGKATWSLLKPANSKAQLTVTNTLAINSFIPDVVGAYMVTAALQSADGKTTGETQGVQLHAGMFNGDNANACKTCHASKVEDWLKTGHSTIFKDEIDNARTPDVPTHYSESCARCHTTGYYAAPYGGSGGFKDQMTATKWQFPTFKQIDAAQGKPVNWDAMPKPVQNMGNIQCEDCHGPAKEHVATGAPVMQASLNDGVCNQCHNGGGHHLKGTDLSNAEHSDANSAAFNTPVGPGEQQCVRCHSGRGYASFLSDPKNPAAWDNNKQTIGCSTCHDPHGNGNMFQLRVIDKPVEIPNPPAGGVGLSATCYECHNSRVAVKDYASGATPHYSSIVEMIDNVGGVTYGKDVPNSGHSMVGSAPIKNPAYTAGSDVGQFLFSKTDDTKGNVPGACVACHMWPTIEDAKDPNYHKVGSHSFNMVSPDGKFDYTAACKSCHGDLTSFDIKAKADYDGNGKVEGVQEEVGGLLDKLWTAMEAKGVKKVASGYPYATLPKGADGKVDPKITNAWINYRTVYGVMWGQDEESNPTEGQAGAPNAIHNFKRSVALLQLAYKDLTGQDVPNAEILVK